MLGSKCVSSRGFGRLEVGHPVGSCIRIWSLITQKWVGFSKSSGPKRPQWICGDDIRISTATVSLERFCCPFLLRKLFKLKLEFQLGDSGATA